MSLLYHRYCLVAYAGRVMLRFLTSQWVICMYDTLRTFRVFLPSDSADRAEPHHAEI